MNRVTLVGRTTKDIDYRVTPSGVPVATFTLAVKRPFSGGDGKQESDFIQVVTWRRQAENAANYVRKGSLVGVDGRIQTRNYDGNDGKKVYVTEVVADSVQFLEPKGKQEQKSQANNDPIFDDPFANNGQKIEFDPDALPF